VSKEVGVDIEVTIRRRNYLKTIHRRQIKGFVKESKYSGCWSGAEPVAQT
jgi:hypothetical protein